MTKLVPVAIAIALASSAAPAHAELTAGFEITFSELEIQDAEGNFSQPADSYALRNYLNLAHCLCGGPTPQGEETEIRLLAKSAVDTDTDRAAELWVGTSCDDETLRGMQCRKLDQTLQNVDLLVTSPSRITLPLYDLMVGDDDSCANIQGTRQLWVLFDEDGDGTYDYEEPYEVGTGVFDDVTQIDTTAPPAPTKFVGSSAEDAVRISWTPDATTSDIYYTQILCAKPDGTPALDSPAADARYALPSQLCGISDENAIVVSETELDSEDAEAEIPSGLASLDPSYICGQLGEATGSAVLVEGLENGVAYSLAVVTVDKYGNAVANTFKRTVTPKPAYDFWEDLHNRGSNVEGGFCLAGTTSGPGGTLGPLALALGFLIVRRRRRGRALVELAPVATLIVVGAIALPGVAHAQGTTPYWEEQQAEDAFEAEQDLVKWHVGIRVGPYTPEIDKQFGMDPGPYHEMFGGYQILPMLDIDRIVWRGVGQLGFGGSIGYMQKTAHAWATPVPGEDRMRSEGDTNTFRLLPIAATAVYRFTWLDDNYGIPVVPYVRGGLSYYVWWMRTNGKTSTACWDGSDTPNCDADKAYGATIGVQGSIGIAIRAERVDAAAATAMKAGGIEHAGFYGELSLAKVDGFGSDAKLSVGDTTWFAGVNFEF